MKNKKLDELLKDGGFEIKELIPERLKNRIELIDAKEMQEMKLADINWIIRDLAPEGLAVLAGRPKIGKSWMAMDFATSVARGTRTLGYFDTTSSSVLYLPYEDNYRRLQSRLNLVVTGSVSEEAPKNLFYPKDNFDFPKLNETGADEIEKILDNNIDIRFVVIDTLGRGIADKARRDRSIYHADYDLSSKLQKIAMERNICVLLLHHTRKEKAEYIFDEISGSTGLTAGFDTMMVINRTKDGHTLNVTGRDVIESEYRIEFDESTCVWRVAGKVSELKMTAEREEIYELIKTYGRQMKTGEIAEALGKTKSNISKMLGKMVRDDVLKSVSYGVYDFSDEERERIRMREQFEEIASESAGVEDDQEELFEDEEEEEDRCPAEVVNGGESG